MIVGLIVVIVVFSIGIYWSSMLISSDNYTNSESDITLIDGLGRNITIKHPVERVVSLASSISEIICALNASDILYAVDQYSTFPPILKDKLDTVEGFNAGSSSTPTKEIILNANPDIVFVWPYCSIIEDIEDQGIPVFVLKYPTNIYDILELMETVGYIIGKDNQSQEITSFMTEHINIVENRTKDLEEKPLVYYELSQPGKTGNSSTIAGSLIQISGGINIAGNNSLQYLTLNSEYIIDANPDVIIRFYYGTEPNTEEMNQLKEDIMNRPGWDVINAIENNKVYVIDYSECSTNPRLIIGLVRYAIWIHSELFEDLNVNEVSDYVYANIYGLDTT